MRRVAPARLPALALALWLASPIGLSAARTGDGPTSEELVRLHVANRLERDLEALERFRPGYTFWQYVFTIPDGEIVFGSERDGRLLATFPVRGDWSQGARWEDGTLAPILENRRLPSRLSDRRDQVVELLEPAVGPVMNNQTRGDFLLPNARRYGGFLAEWSAIYERFGVPGDLGLAQAVVESGLAGRIKSEARAVGFCQWLPRNWERLNRLAPVEIEAQNQTTQAAYCAAFLTVLATKYGTFIPALSEHHAGVTNVGRTVINGGRLGAEGVRERYLMGAEFARDLRALSPRTFRDVVGTFGPRSFLYAEMVFGNAFTVRKLRATTTQERVFGMRTPRAIPLTEITRETGLSVDEVKRFNPALVRQVPKGATLYLPRRVERFGSDVSFWHRPAPDAFAAVLNEFVRLSATPEEWNDPAFDAVLRDFRRRFQATRTEEGDVMQAVIGYAMQDMAGSRPILSEYRESPHVMRVFEQGVQRRAEALGASAAKR